MSFLKTPHTRTYTLALLLMIFGNTINCNQFCSEFVYYCALKRQDKIGQCIAQNWGAKCTSGSFHLIRKEDDLATPVRSLFDPLRL